MKPDGLLIVLSGPSGCGKGTMIGELMKTGDYAVSISMTTRAPREGEVDGVHYHFVTREQFEQMIAEDGFLEYAQYCDNYYGTPRAQVDAWRAEGKNVILEIEVQGAFQVKKRCPETVLVFTIPPTVEELSRRLHKRGTETEEVIQKRISKALEELPRAKEYDYIVLNDALEDAVQDFLSVVRAEQLRSKHVELKF